MIANKISTKLKKSGERGEYTALLVLLVLSLVLFLSSFMSDGDKFYYLPCRFFELAVGGLLGKYHPRKEFKVSYLAGNSFIIFLIGLLLVGLIGFN